MWTFQKKLVDTDYCLVWNVIIYESVLSLGMESLKQNLLKVNIFSQNFKTYWNKMLECRKTARKLHFDAVRDTEPVISLECGSALKTEKKK